MGAPSGRAATTASSAPTLLAKYFSPVRSQRSPEGTATVSTAPPRSEPPLISVIHVAPCQGRPFLLSSWGMYAAFSSSLPYFSRGMAVERETV